MTAVTAANQDRFVLPWWVVLLEGIAAIIIGIMLLVSPGMTTLIVIQVLGIYWLITGIFQIVAIFIDSSQWGWKLFAGILGIVAGLIILRHPLWSALLVPATLVIMLGIWGIIIGIVNLIQAFQGGGWGIGILGVLSIIIGILLLGNVWIAAFSLPVVVGLFAIVGGILALVAAFRIRGEQHQVAVAETVATRAPQMVESATAAAVTGVAAAEAAGAQVVEGATAAAVTGVAAVEAAGAEVGVAATRLAETVAEEAPDIAVGPVAVAEQIEQALASLAPEVLTKLHNSPEYVEGIGAAYAQTLKGIGIDSLLALLKQGATPKGRTEIAERSGISPKLILAWVNHIDLYRVKGVGSEYADLLERAGVDTVVELAMRNPGNLLARMTAVNEEKHLVRRLPVQSQVEEWVAQAKELPRVINY
jgi:uncharacterized membrane protein HdeD (DUF308 family)/predicted flap endonuclease-1-like 5' DNA nuclease